MVQTADKQEPTNTLTVTDTFTRLVWIDPNSPTLQRKGVADGAIRGVDEEEEEEEEEDKDKIKADEDVEDENEMVEEQDDEYEMEDEQDQEDARTAFEEENRVQTEGWCYWMNYSGCNKKTISNFTFHLLKVGKLKGFKKVSSDLKTIFKTKTPCLRTYILRTCLV